MLLIELGPTNKIQIKNYINYFKRTRENAMKCYGHGAFQIR